MPQLAVEVTDPGLVVDVQVHISEARLETLTALNEPIPPTLRCRGLLDTGASCSVVDVHLINSLHLHPTGVGLIHSPTTSGIGVRCNQYDVSLKIVGHEFNAIFQPLQGIATDLGGLGIDVLIGLDVLKECLLVYNGPSGKFTLAK